MEKSGDFVIFNKEDQDLVGGLLPDYISAKAPGQIQAIIQEELVSARQEFTYISSRDVHESGRAHTLEVANASDRLFRLDKLQGDLTSFLFPAIFERTFADTDLDIGRLYYK